MMDVEFRRRLPDGSEWVGSFPRERCWMCHKRPMSDRKPYGKASKRFVVCDVCLDFQREYIETGKVLPIVPPREEDIAIVMNGIGVSRELAVVVLSPPVEN